MHQPAHSVGLECTQSLLHLLRTCYARTCLHQSAHSIGLKCTQSLLRCLLHLLRTYMFAPACTLSRLKMHTLLRCLLHLLRTCVRRTYMFCFPSYQDALATHLLRTCCALDAHLLRTCYALATHLLRTCYAFATHLLRTCYALATHLLRTSIRRTCVTCYAHASDVRQMHCCACYAHASDVYVLLFLVSRCY